MIIKSLQSAGALKALRLDRKRELLEDLREIDRELEMLNDWIKQYYDNRKDRVEVGE